MMRSEKFLMTWVVVVCICIDIIWISFAADQLSLINFLKLATVDIFTYILLIVKIILMLYLLLIEKAFASEKQGDHHDN